MSVLQFRKAERKKAKARIGISGPAGSGKTYSSLLVAKGLGGKTAMIDTENGSGDLYAHIFNYDILQIEAPFTPEKYINAIKAAEEAGYGTIIVDSLTHAWAGEGGLLDLQGKIADSGKANSYTAWRLITPKHNALVEAMLQSKCHIIATMRAKMDYVQQSSNGKTEIKKVGLAPIQRDGMEYEFTVFFEVGQDHNATATKDRTTIFDGKYLILNEKTGETLKKWLEDGTEAKEEAKPAKPQMKIAPVEEPKEETKPITEEERIKTIVDAMNEAATDEELKKACDTYRTDYDMLSKEGKDIVITAKRKIKEKISKAA